MFESLDSPRSFSIDELSLFPSNNGIMLGGVELLTTDSNFSRATNVNRDLEHKMYFMSFDGDIEVVKLKDTNQLLCWRYSSVEA